MPTLPTFDVSQAQADRVLAAFAARFGTTTTADTVRAFKRWKAEAEHHRVIHMAAHGVLVLYGLLIIGFATLSRLSRAKSAAIVISLWLLTVVVKLGFAAMAALGPPHRSWLLSAPLSATQRRMFCAIDGRLKIADVSIDLHAELPRNERGKIDRHALVEPVRDELRTLNTRQRVRRAVSVAGRSVRGRAGRGGRRAPARVPRSSPGRCFDRAARHDRASPRARRPARG